MLPRRDVSALFLSLALIACGGMTDRADDGRPSPGLAGSSGNGSSAGAGGNGASDAGASAGGTASKGGSASDNAPPSGGPCDEHGGGTCGPTELCSYASAPACGIGGTCVPRPGGCITIENPKHPCMCDGARTPDACWGMIMNGESPAPFAAACHPGEDLVVCSADPWSGPGCGTREHCDTTGAAGSSSMGVCRPLPAP